MWDETVNFLTEFYERRKKELKEDVVKIREFYIKNKVIIFWIIVCCLSLEVLDYASIMRGIGNIAQKGGNGGDFGDFYWKAPLNEGVKPAAAAAEAPKPAAAAAAAAAAAEAPKAAAAEAPKPAAAAEAPKPGAAAAEAPKPGAAAGAPAADGKPGEPEKPKDTSTHARRRGKKELKKSLKSARKDYASRVGAKFRKKSGLDYLSKKGQGFASQFTGPSALGFMGKFGDVISRAFYIVGIMLVIVGAITLPILLVMVITYFVIKHIAGKIMSL